MAMKVYFKFSKAPALLKPHNQSVKCHIQDTCWRESYPSVEMQSVYSKAPADWASQHQMQFSVIHKALFSFFKVGILTLCRRYSPCILSPANRAIDNNNIYP